MPVMTTSSVPGRARRTRGDLPLPEVRGRLDGAICPHRNPEARDSKVMKWLPAAIGHEGAVDSILGRENRRLWRPFAIDHGGLRVGVRSMGGCAERSESD